MNHTEDRAQSLLIARYYGRTWTADYIHRRDAKLKAQLLEQRERKS